ncbi:MAG: hypothetical protein Fur006_15890 [Coleofasciculaceae cyanobacterium]|jgi:predicted deacylase
MGDRPVTVWVKAVYCRNKTEASEATRHKIGQNFSLGNRDRPNGMLGAGHHG